MIFIKYLTTHYFMIYSEVFGYCSTAILKLAASFCLIDVQPTYCIYSIVLPSFLIGSLFSIQFVISLIEVHRQAFANAVCIWLILFIMLAGRGSNFYLTLNQFKYQQVLIKYELALDQLKTHQQIFIQELPFTAGNYNSYCECFLQINSFGHWAHCAYSVFFQSLKQLDQSESCAMTYSLIQLQFISLFLILQHSRFHYKVIDNFVIFKMERSNQMQQQQVWMQLLGPKTCCSLIHPDNPCIVEIIAKCATVVKKSSKMYVALYFAMIILQIGKLRKEKNRGKFVMKWFKDFLGSLAFMSWLVGGMKTSLCILNNLNAPLDGRAMFLLSGIGSTSIFFNEKSKRQEIAYFVVVRAVRSAYIYFKKRFRFPLKSQKQICFITIFTLISYLFFEGGPNMKNRKFIQNLWGEF